MCVPPPVVLRLKLPSSAQTCKPLRSGATLTEMTLTHLTTAVCIDGTTVVCTDTPRRPHEARTLLGECQGAPLGQVRVTPTLVAVVGRARPRPPHLVIRATVHVPVLRTADAAHAARLCRGRNEQQSQPTGQGASTDCGAHCHSAEVSNLSILASRLTSATSSYRVCRRRLPRVGRSGWGGRCPHSPGTR